MSQKIGLEVANGYIKVVSDDIEISYPNRLKMLTGEEFDVVGTLGSIYEFEGDQYIIDSTGTSSGGRNSNRYLTKEYLLEALVAISQVIKERNIVLTVGVPCRDFRKEQLKESIINNLKGRHELKVIKGKTTERFEINILEVFVVVEPMGTLCDYVFNNKFEIVDNRNHSKSLIIDIGYSTTDILATDGLRIEKLHGADVGCMDIANQFLREINSLDERFELKDGDVLFILAGDEHIIKIAGLLRNYLGEELELTDHNRFEFCIVNDFPFFEYNEEDNGKGIEFERFYNTRAGITVYFNTSNYFDIHMTGLN